MAHERLSLRTALRLDVLPRPVVLSLVGAGGKTSLMLHLAREVEGSSLRALFTTTTRLWVHQFHALPRPRLAASEEEFLTAAERVEPGHPVSVARLLLDSEAKAQGVLPEWVDRLAERGYLDLIVIEADGSREKPLKAPGPDEPVVPERTSLFVTLAGWRAVGKPLSAAWVHRPDRLAALADLPMEERITPEVLARVLARPDGGLKGRPGHARAVWCINQVDDIQMLPVAESTARQILARAHPLLGDMHHLPPEVIIASLRPESSSSDTGRNADPIHSVVGRVAAVVLAAGAGTRFGGPKQVALWRGRPLIHHVLDAVAAAQVDEVVVVVGAWAQQVTDAVRSWQRARGEIQGSLRVVHNPEWVEGQSTSVRVGLRATGPVSAAVFPLADQPGISSALLDALIAEHRRSLAAIVRPRYPDGPGAPVLFDFTMFPELLNLRGDTGGRAVVRAFLERVRYVDWPDAAAALDIDTRADLER